MVRNFTALFFINLSGLKQDRKHNYPYKIQ